MTWDAMQPELTKMYTETFTEPELKEMAKFYGSPVGQKALEKMPEMMQRVGHDRRADLRSRTPTSSAPR